MAIKSTIFKATLQVADIDHSYYAEHVVTLARHPSETDERMMVRLAALALNAHTVQSVCQGDGKIGMGKGLSDPDDPDVLLSDYTGRKRLWIEVGQPEEKPLIKAGSQADAVHVYPFGPAAELWWKAIESRLTRLDKVKIWRFPTDAARELATLAERSMQLHATIQDQTLTLGGDRNSVTMEPVVWKA